MIAKYRFRRYSILFIAIAFNAQMTGYAISAEFSCADIKTIKENILRKISDIGSYRLNAVIKMNTDVVSTQICGQLPDRLYITQTIKTGFDKMMATMIFDGKFQWVESNSANKKKVLKIRSSELARKERPFDTGYYLMGTGLINGEDFPSTIRILLSTYNLTADCQPDDIVLSGYLDPDRFEEYVNQKTFKKNNTRLIENFKTHFGYAKIHFAYPGWMIKGYSLGSNSMKEEIAISFDDIKINPADIGAVFQYKVPNGANPIDITHQILQALAEDG